ncbi:hypothetical protein CLV43_106352 [Umezawaea tangerina]|uniref:Uncharacterized protein n=1 Tax=Umezawaea tangerina TaxID=84725 RepID=A0A2T0T4P8_9PSEU|nr:hypothetical protein CLV43_106352 [Umezawaea tangerina]
MRTGLGQPASSLGGSALRSASARTVVAPESDVATASVMVGSLAGHRRSQVTDKV